MNYNLINTKAQIETEVSQIMLDLGMDSPINHRSFEWLKELIILAIYHPDGWQNYYLDDIGKRENLTRERVRQMLYKAVSNNWRRESKSILEKHFGYPVQTQFKYVKPNHIEFIELTSDELRKKYNK